MPRKGSDNRTTQMIKNFVRLKKSGKTISEIARHYKLTTRTIYNHLDEISKASGIPREELLDKVHSPHVMTKSRTCSSKEHVDPKELEKHFSNMISEIDKITAKIDIILEKDDTNNTEALQEEEK